MRHEVSLMPRAAASLARCVESEPSLSLWHSKASRIPGSCMRWALKADRCVLRTIEVRKSGRRLVAGRCRGTSDYESENRHEGSTDRIPYSSTQLKAVTLEGLLSGRGKEVFRSTSFIQPSYSSDSPLSSAPLSSQLFPCIP